MEGIPSVPTTPGGKKNTFLLNKEKFWGGLATVGFVTIAGALLYKALPFIIEMLGMAITATSQLIVLAGLAVVLAVFLAVVLNPRTWAMFRYGYAVAARKITKAMVHMAPTDMLMAYSHEFLEKKLAIFREKRTNVKAQVDKLTQLINRNVDKREKAFREASYLKEKSYTADGWSNETDHGQFKLRSQMIEQLDNSNERIQAQLDRLVLLEKILAKFERAFEFKIKEIQQWVEIFSTEYEALRDAAAAGQQAISVVVGDEEKRIFDLTVDTMRDDIAQFQGQVESALEVTSQLTSSHDIESGAAEQKIMRALTQLDSNADRLIANAQQSSSVLRTKDAKKIVSMVSDQGPKPVVESVDFRRQSKYGLRRNS